MKVGWRIVAIGGCLLIGLTLLLGVFALGMRVAGMRTTRPDLRSPLLSPLLHKSGRGVVGTIELVDLPGRVLVVRNDKNEAVRVLLSEDTILERHGQRVDLVSVGVGERIVAIGAPDSEGRLVARVIRVLGRRPGQPGLPRRPVGKIACQGFRSLGLVFQRLMCMWRTIR